MKKGGLRYAGFGGGLVKTDDTPLPGDKLFACINMLLNSEGYLEMRNGSVALGSAPPFPDAPITSLHGMLGGSGSVLLAQSGTNLSLLNVSDDDVTWETPAGASPTVAHELRSAQYGTDLYLTNGTDFLRLTGNTVENMAFTTIGKSRRFCLWQNRLWAYDDPDNDDRLYYSSLDTPDVFNGNFYRVSIRNRDEGRLITVVPAVQSLLLLKNNCVYVATGSPSVDATTNFFDIQKLISGVGTIAADTVVGIGTGYIGMWYDGIYLVQVGDTPQNLTSGAFNDFMSDLEINKDCVNKCSATIFKGRYILLYPSGDSTYNNRALVVDTRFSPCHVSIINGMDLVDLTKCSYSFSAAETVVLSSDSFGNSSLNTGLWTPENSVTESDFGYDMKNCLRIRSRVVSSGDADPDKEDDPDETTVGTGTPSDPIILRTASDLEGVRSDLTLYYKQIRNIDASGLTWIPIGDSSTKFTGGYDGNGYKISGLVLPDQDYSGLFGYLDTTAQVQDVLLRNISTLIASDKSTCGALVGHNNGLIIRCSSMGTMSGGSLLGGLVGQNGAVIQDSYSTCDVSGVSSVGGLVGFDSTNNILKYDTCYATGNVYGSGTMIGGFIGACRCGALTSEVNNFLNCYAIGNVSGGAMVGGFVGTASAHGSTSIYGTFKSCCATGNVSGTGDVGGFVGFASEITANHKMKFLNCYASGNVSRIGATSSYFGGFFGWQYRGYAVNCYATGEVDGNQYSGGFAGSAYTCLNCYSVGKVYDNASNTGGFSGAGSGVTGCYWDKTTSGWATSASGTGKTTAEMMVESTFSGWDFTDIWDIVEGMSYPFFESEIAPPEPVEPVVPGRYGAGVGATSAQSLEVLPSLNIGLYYNGASKPTDGFYIGVSSDASAPASWDSTTELTDPIGIKVLNNRMYLIFSSSVVDSGVDIDLLTWVRFRIAMSNGSGAKFEYNNGYEWQALGELTGGPSGISVRPFFYSFVPPADASSEIDLYVRSYTLSQGIDSFTAVEKETVLYAGSAVSPGKVYNFLAEDVFTDDGMSINVQVGGGWNVDPSSGCRKKLTDGIVEFEGQYNRLQLSFFSDNYVPETPSASVNLSTNTPWIGTLRQQLRFKKHLNYKRLRWLISGNLTDKFKLYMLHMHYISKQAWVSTDTEV